jgi:hypothetical protein
MKFGQNEKKKTTIQGEKNFKTYLLFVIDVSSHRLGENILHKIYD